MDRTEIERKILALIAKSGRVQAVTPAMGLGEIPGWDSLKHAEFIIDLQREFGVRLSTPQILALESPEAAVRAVEAALEKKK